MRVGFTGARRGMTSEQIMSFDALISSLDVTEFHHGDCVGADARAHTEVLRRCPLVSMHIHPPDNPSARAFVRWIGQ